MTQRDSNALIRDILDACADIRTFLAGCTFEQFEQDRMKQYAVIKGLEIIGEAAGKLPKGTRDQHPAVPWKSIVGMRNILIHVYHELDLEIVWRTASVFAPQLEAQLKIPPARNMR